MLIDQCPVCNGRVAQESVTETIHGGGHAVVATLEALVCQQCGARFYSLDDTRRLEALQKKLERQETEGLQPTGQSFALPHL